MTILDVIVPDGVLPGELLSIDAGGGRLLEVCVPPGCYGGDSLSVAIEEGEEPDMQGSTSDVVVRHQRADCELPARPCPHSHQRAQRPCSLCTQEPTMETLQVEVPDGLSEGESFLVETSWGGCFDVCVPPGCPPGTHIFCELPLPPSPPPDWSPGQSGSESSREPRERRVSREVPASHVSSSRSRRPSHEVPLSSVSRRHVDEPRDCAMEQTIEPSPDEAGEGDGLATPISAPPNEGHKYRPGTRVHVLRTDGSYSAGCVWSSYDGVFDVLYQVTKPADRAGARPHAHARAPCSDGAAVRALRWPTPRPLRACSGGRCGSSRG